MDVVSDGKPFAGERCGCSGRDVAAEPVLGVLDLARVVLVVIISVDIEVGDVVSKVSHSLFAAGLSSAAGIRRSHVGGEESEDIAQSHLVLDHLVLAVNGRNGAQVQMGPSMGSNLVAFGVHPLDRGLVAGSDVDLSLINVVSRDEEGRLCVVRLEDIQDVVGVVG